MAPLFCFCVKCPIFQRRKTTTTSLPFNGLLKVVFFHPLRGHFHRRRFPQAIANITLRITNVSVDTN